MAVELALLPDKRLTVIVVGTTVRKPAAVLRHFLASLAAQELPENTILVPVFVDDNVDEEARTMLRTWARERNGNTMPGVPAPVEDFSDAHPDTHQWTPSAMSRVGQNKDLIIAEARRLNADYLWFCDADLVCDTTTLKSMLAAAHPIVTAVYWTRWHARDTETRRIHAAPQVWLNHPYRLDGNGWTEAEFRARLAARQLTPVAGYGACTLIDRRALDAGVSFAYIPGVSTQGMMAGEDRHFCLRARALHLPAVADPWPDIYHIYHLPADLNRASQFVSRLTVTHPERAQFGDLVNLTVQPVEPLPYASGGYTAVPPQQLRGRLGQLALMPELEEAIYDLKRGETRIVPVHFPAHYEVPFYQGKRRLIRVTLNDVKPLTHPPILEDEILLGARSGAFLRTVDYTTRQLDGMREVANAG